MTPPQLRSSDVYWVGDVDVAQLADVANSHHAVACQRVADPDTPSLPCSDAPSEATESDSGHLPSPPDDDYRFSPAPWCAANQSTIAMDDESSGKFLSSSARSFCNFTDNSPPLTPQLEGPLPFASLEQLSEINAKYNRLVAGDSQLRYVMISEFALRDTFQLHQSQLQALHNRLNQLNMEQVALMKQYDELKENVEDVLSYHATVVDDHRKSKRDRSSLVKECKILCARYKNAPRLTYGKQIPFADHYN
ncbi:hypothetical protein JAAARDRAFT_187281 [Jaapia argillacea MUCL 33604]|uniref:Uncharacterized protein n=1 Tax=Jaapia argillacea MUCL 33604 TaxID=933084 RepID=A0A067QCK7_9AGAM|nr:hypothetical protein JAAARDRAFT_187281 [Jaapia argillacea MUCL 33604]